MTCCSRSCSTRAWRRNRALSISAMWCKRLSRNSSVGIRTSLPNKVRRPRARWKDYGSASKRRKSRQKKTSKNGTLAGVPVALPALSRALKLQVKASKVGFDWNDPRAVLRKIREEADEIEAELDGPETNQSAAAAEIGDLLFAVVNLARHLDADPEAVLRQTNLKFERRFAAIERALAARGKAPQDATLVEMDRLWNQAKEAE